MRLFLLFAVLSFFLHPICADVHLIPPKGWECIEDQEQLPQKVKRIYIGTGKGQFTPSINIACEETSLAIDAYLRLAQEYHEKQDGALCRKLGTLDTCEGAAQLLQIDRGTQWGNVRFMQAILIKEGVAYVLTATCLQDEFAPLSQQLFKAMQSFTIR